MYMRSSIVQGDIVDRGTDTLVVYITSAGITCTIDA